MMAFIKLNGGTNKNNLICHFNSIHAALRAVQTLGTENIKQFNKA